MKYIVIGGVAGGATVAARLRRMDEQAEIILLERGAYVSYANCGLPYYIGGEISERDHLFVQTVKGFQDRFAIDIRVRQEAVEILREQKAVRIKNLETGVEYTESYDKLVLSPGAAPIRPNLEGINLPNIFTLRNVPDTDAIKNYITANRPRRAVVVGGGFIGLEMAENLHRQGLEVHVVEMGRQVMAPIDYSMASIVHHHMVEQGIHLHLERGVTRFASSASGVLEVVLSDEQKIETDMVILSIGVRPETTLAKDSGLAIGALGGISVNEYMQTSDPDIYALGDAVEVVHGVTGKPALIPLAGPANKQGRIVADNIVYGNVSVYSGTIGTSIAQVFDLTVAAAGANSKLLDREKIPYLSSFTHSQSHAGYYPGAVSMSVKILFSPENGRLLGAQIVGFDGVDKRIEMLAQVIQNQGTVADLMELEHAYAPPYSSAKDPVNMAGFVADNILKKRVETILWSDVASLPADAVKIDVRTPAEYELGTIPGFVNIPVDELRGRLAELPKDRLIVVTCAIGLRGYLAYRILKQHGFTNVKNLSGGYKTWSAATMPVGQPDASCDSCCGDEPCSTKNIVEVNACGLMCPGPIMKLKSTYEQLDNDAMLCITATDQAFAKDVKSWCKMTGADLVSLDKQAGQVKALVRKQQPKACAPAQQGGAENKTIVVFSDDLDKALASFVIANGAASTGKKVSMFFTFWGLNVIKKSQKPAVEKDIWGRMFSWMLPSDSKALKLSQMNMMGIGSKMMRFLMKKKKIDSLESLIAQAREQGVEFIACTMSMDVMGVKKEELLDDVTLGGVATYLERTEEANLNLFI
jgi:NADPH-dependent 2,4-dienoyl-CoA reductase/sulfur reductase-like enzyme/peroxiredoxin family protein/rhodanese-related sulfurtransferase/TusA-related sulfurtransferase